MEVYVLPKTVQMTIPLYGEGTTHKVLSSYVQNNTLHLELERTQHELPYDDNRFKDGSVSISRRDELPH